MKHTLNVFFFFVLAAVACVSCGEKSPQEKLEKEIANEKKSVPMEVSEGVMWTDVTLKPDCVYYLYELSGKATVQEYQLKTDEIKSQLFKAMEKDSYRDFINCVVQTGRGMRYCYRQKATGEQVEINVTCDELKKKL